MDMEFGLFCCANNRLIVFENLVVSRIFGLKRKKMTGDWRKLHNKGHHILYSAPNIILGTKSMRMSWLEYKGGHKCIQKFI
jgi:hypothetical protein